MDFPTRKVILTGYRATGKSTVGRELAARLGFEFLDMDKAIEEQEGASIRQLVAEHGWDYFRQRERELLTGLIPRGSLVVATGGGAILQQDIWRRLMQAGLCVWLTADQEVICQRLAADASSDEQRPSLTGIDIGREVHAVLSEREPLYRQGSHIAIDTTGRSIDSIVTEIITAFNATP